MAYLILFACLWLALAALVAMAEAAVPTTERKSLPVRAMLWCGAASAVLTLLASGIANIFS
jgi:hypothetical protein